MSGAPSKINVFSRYRYFFYGFLAYILVFIILSAIAYFGPGGERSPVLGLYLYSFAPLVYFKKLIGTAGPYVISNISPTEILFLYVIYGLVIGTCNQLFFNLKNRKSKEKNI